MIFADHMEFNHASDERALERWVTLPTITWCATT
jgi:hypothetical protein